jgi:hypothetical protein
MTSCVRISGFYDGACATCVLNFRGRSCSVRDPDPDSAIQADIAAQVGAPNEEQIEQMDSDLDDSDAHESGDERSKSQLTCGSLQGGSLQGGLSQDRQLEDGELEQNILVASHPTDALEDSTPPPDTFYAATGGIVNTEDSAPPALPIFEERDAEKERRAHQSVDGLKAQVAVLKSVILSIKSRDRLVSSLEKSLDQLKKENASLKSEHSKTRQDVNTLTKKYGKLKHENSILIWESRHRQELQDTVLPLKNKVRDKARTILALKREVSLKDERITTLVVENEALREEVEALEDERDKRKRRRIQDRDYLA